MGKCRGVSIPLNFNIILHFIRRVSPISFQAWDSVIKGTEKLAELLQFSFDGLTTKVMDKLTSLITDKKAARKNYEDERNRLEKEFSRVSSIKFLNVWSPNFGQVCLSKQ